MRELFSIEAEHGLLGALLHDAELFDEISSKIDTGDFSLEENAALYRAILDTQASGQPIDPVTVGIHCAYLPNGDSMLAFAAEVARNVPSVANWRAYARVVLERSALRRVVQAADVIRDSVNNDLPVAEVIALAQQATADLRNLDGEEQDYYRVSEVLTEVIDTIDSKFNKTMPVGLSTGLTELDKIICGLRPTNMVVVAGLPGSGKTTLGVQIAQNVACRQAGSGLVFSMEMTRQELVTRNIASLGGVNLSRLDDGDLADEDWPKITSAVNILNSARLFVSDQPGMTVARIRAIARQCQRREGLSVVVVDYIGLITAEGSNNRTLELGKISTSLKNLAKELKVPVIVLAQLNRGSTNRPDKRPRPSDLRDSGQIEADADVVVLVHRDNDTEEGQNGVTQLIVGKCRHAKIGDCLVQQQGAYVRFVNFEGAAPPSNDEVEMGRKFAGRGYRGGYGDE